MARSFKFEARLLQEDCEIVVNNVWTNAGMRGDHNTQVMLCRVAGDLKDWDANCWEPRHTRGSSDIEGEMHDGWNYTLSANSKACQPSEHKGPETNKPM